MLQSQRFVKIEELVNEKGIVNTKEMAVLLGVTEKTIRLDYEELEKRGRLVRVHGGAKSIKKKIITTRDEKQMRERTEHLAEKEAICRRAAEMVTDGACVFLDGGSSIAPLIKYLRNKKIKIVTNSQLVVNAFDSEKVELFVVGGSYIPKYNMTAGPLALAEISRFNFDFAFISCLGVDIDRKMIYTAEVETMAVKEAAMKLAVKSILLIDSTKLYIKGFCSLISLTSFDTVLCNRTDYINMDDLPGNFILVGEENV